MIVADPAKCSGCTRCEMACSFGKTKAYSHLASVIRVVKDEEIGFDFPVTCIRCYRCVAACPIDALSVTSKGLIKLDREKCRPKTWARLTGVSTKNAESCGICAEACPLGILDFDEYPSFCTNCGRCIEACNQDALSFEEKPELPKVPSAADLENKSPAMRRLLWAKKHLEKLSWAGE